MDQELTYKWIQERLRELHSGTLSEKDRLRLVEIAKEDPFVADALEGFNAHPDAGHTEHLDRLTEKIRYTRPPRRRWLIPNLTVTAVAASVLLIVATYMVITRIEKPSEETLFVFVAPDSLTLGDSTTSGIAMETDTRMPDAEVEKSYASEGKATKEMPSQPAIKGIDKKSSPASAGSTAATHTIVQPEEPSTESETVNAVTAAAPPDDAQPAAVEDMDMASHAEMSRAKKDEGYYANQMDPAMMLSRVTGRVVDAEQGDPIMAAKITVSYSNQLYYTDIEGRFELFIPDPEAVIQVAYPGYNDSTLVVSQKEENIQVGMKPGALLQEIVIAGTNAKGPLPASDKDPIESFRNFNQYVTSSSLLQLTTEPSLARRKVTLEFNVKNNGRPRDITIIESSRDKTYDGEAKRLLESGPDWVCSSGSYPCKRTYTFYFR